MDQQTELLISIRDILTRIERVLGRIEAAGQAQGPATVLSDVAVPSSTEPVAAAPIAPPVVAKPVVATASPMTGRGKWRQR